MDMETSIMLAIYILGFGGVSVFSLVKCMHHNQWDA